MRSSSRPDRLLSLALPALALVAEAAWVTVAYVAVQTVIAGAPPVLGTFELTLAAAVGAVAVRRGLVRPDDQPIGFLALLLAVGAVGWLWDADARQLVGEGDPIAALAVHAGGWVAVVAAMRGVGHAFDVDDRAVTRLVLVGVPALSIPWALGHLASGTHRPVFVEEAFVASLTFVAAGFMTAGLARLQEIGRETGIDWRRDRSWLGTVLGVLVAVLALGIPSAMLLGLPGDAVARGILGPLVGLVGWAFVAVLTVAAAVAALVATALSTVGIQLPPPMTPEEIARLPAVRVYSPDEIREPLTWMVVAWIALVVVIVVLLRVWVRRRAPGRRRSDREERSFRIPPRGERPRAEPAAPARRPTRSREPSDAVAAYVAVLDELAQRDPARARQDHETPRAHARRVTAGTDLAALQADYSLARYGGRSLTASEDRRAVRRWRRVRDALRRGLH
jgi:hypothetical protein